MDCVDVSALGAGRLAQRFDPVAAANDGVRRRLARREAPPLQLIAGGRAS